MAFSIKAGGAEGTGEVDNRDLRPSPTVVVKEGSRLGLVDALNKYTEVRRSKYYSPTTVSASKIDGCARAIYYEAHKYEQRDIEGKPEWRMVAEFGTALHALMEQWFQDLGATTETRIVSDDHTFSAQFDGTLHTKDGERVIYDIKTVAPKYFEQGERSFKFRKYIAQLSTAGYLEGIRYAVVLLVNRESGALREYEFEIDPVYAEALLKRARDVMGMIENEQLPPAELWGKSDEYPSFYCKTFCPFLLHCTKERN